MDDSRSVEHAPPRPGRCVVAPGDAMADRDDLLRLAGNLPGSPGARRFEKYYDRSPFGPPSVFLAREPGSGRAVGMAALLPSRLRVLGKPVAAAVSADFAIDPEYRGFGPALALQRASLKSLPERGMMCAYGCPNPLSEPIVKRVGFEEVAALTRFVKVLRGRLVIDLYVGRPGLARILSASSTVTADPVLRALSRERRGRGSGLSFERPAMFDDRFGEVWEATARRHAITGERSAEILNWKYELDTARPSGYSIFAAVEPGGRVVGYVVYLVKDGVRHIFDIACLESKATIDAPAGRLHRGCAPRARARHRVPLPRVARAARQAAADLRLPAAGSRTSACACTCRRCLPASTRFSPTAGTS